MKWTDVKPTRPGWYWWRWQEFEGRRLGHGPQVLFVDISQDGQFWTPNEFALRGGQWSDAPIPEPEEA